MEPPRIQYALTSDGYTIAYAVSGSGPFLISVPGPPENHLQLEWDDPEARHSIEVLSRHFTLVRFDPRGCGLSQRGLVSFTLEERLRDMEAVVARVGIERTFLLSGGHGNHLAVAWAAAHPDTVERLVAVEAFVRGTDWLTPEVLESMSALLERDYETFVQVVGARLFGWGNEEGPRFSRFYRQCVDQADAIVIYNGMHREDISALLPKVSCPVLAIRHELGDFVRRGDANRFVALLGDARVAVISAALAESGTSRQLRLEMSRFFGVELDEQEPPPPPGPEPAIRTILFTDIESHTALMARLGDERGRVVLREHERIVREALRQFSGNEVKAMGDGFMASFGSATRALECAVAIQRDVRDSEVASVVKVRIGINAGEPIAEDRDLFGQSVIAASRIATAARGGEILVSDVVRMLAAGKGFTFSARGVMALRGLDEEARVYELRWTD